MKQFKAVVGKLGIPDARFHDLRHSYAVASIKSGDDIKTVQSNLGHATASFTLDVYGHVTDQMKQASADRMQKFIEAVSQYGKTLGKNIPKDGKNPEFRGIPGLHMAGAEGLEPSARGFGAARSSGQRVLLFRTVEPMVACCSKPKNRD